VTLRRRIALTRAALGFVAAVTLEVAVGEPAPAWRAARRR
jgi:hypothetical protein